MALYKDGNPVSGLNSIPRLTLAQYNALNVKPEFWVRTDAPESYKKLSADQVSYDSNNTVKQKIDTKEDSIYAPSYKRLLRLTSVRFNSPSDCMGFLLCRGYTGAGDQNCTIIPFGVAGGSAWVDNILVSGGVSKPTASYSDGVITFSWSSEQLVFVSCYIAPMN